MILICCPRILKYPSNVIYLLKIEYLIIVFLKAVEAEKSDSFEMINLVEADERKNKKMDSNYKSVNAQSKYTATPRLPPTTSPHSKIAATYSTPSQLNDISMSWDYYDMRLIPTPGKENSLELEF